MFMILARTDAHINNTSKPVMAMCNLRGNYCQNNACVFYAFKKQEDKSGGNKILKFFISAEDEDILFKLIKITFIPTNSRLKPNELCY